MLILYMLICQSQNALITCLIKINIVLCLATEFQGIQNEKFTQHVFETHRDLIQAKMGSLEFYQEIWQNTVHLTDNQQIHAEQNFTTRKFFFLKRRSGTKKNKKRLQYVNFFVSFLKRKLHVCPLWNTGAFLKRRSIYTQRTECNEIYYYYPLID